jgi:hypothetical protein
MSKKYPECPLYNHDNCKEPSSGKIKSVLKSNKSQKIKSELSGVVVFVNEIENSDE